MLILGSLAGLAILMFLSAWLFNWYYDDYYSDSIGAAFSIAGGVIITVFLLIAIIRIPFARHESRRDVERFNERAASYANAARNGASFDDTDLQLAIVDDNDWLARKQYDNAHLWDLWIDDSVDSLRPIR